MSMSETTNRLFVYGTLRKAPYHEMYRTLARHCTFIGDGVVNGLLFDLGTYPGMVLTTDPTQQTVGEVYEIHEQDRELLWKMLDEYEGCSQSDPKPHEYGKLPVTVKMNNATTTEAMTYVLHRLPNSAVPITSGDYLSWSKERNLSKRAS